MTRGALGTYLVEQRRVRERRAARVRAGAERHVVGRGPRGARAGGEQACGTEAQHRATTARYVVVA